MEYIVKIDSNYIAESMGVNRYGLTSKDKLHLTNLSFFAKVYESEKQALSDIQRLKLIGALIVSLKQTERRVGNTD